jgi:hypothetical protein
MVFPTRKGAGIGGATSCERPNCVVRACKDLSRSVPGEGNGGTSTQTNPTSTIRRPTIPTARKVMASNGEVEGPRESAGRT